MRLRHLDIFILLLLFCSSGSIAQDIDSIAFYKKVEESDLDSKKDLEELVQLFYGEISDKLKFRSGIPFFKDALQHAQKHQYDTLVHRFAYGIAFFYLREKPNLDSCLHYCDLRIEVAKKIGSSKFEGIAYNDIGSAYDRAGMINKSIEYYLMSYNKLKEDELSGTAFPLGNLAWNYYNIGDLERAQYYYSLSVQYEKKLNFPLFEHFASTRMRLLSRIFMYEEQKDSAFHYVNESLKNASVLDSIKDASYQESVMQCFGNAIEVFLHFNEAEKSKVYLEKIIELRKKKTSTITLPYLDFRYYMHIKNYDKAEQFIVDLNEVRENSEETELMSQVDYLNDYASFQKERKFYSKAIEAMKLMVELTDDYYKRNRLENTMLADARFRAREKEEQIKLMEKEEIIHSKTMRIMWISIVLIASIMLLSFFLYSQLKHKNFLLKTDLKNKQIIEEQAENLLKIDKLKSRMFSDIAHELRTPLTLMIGPVEHLLKKDTLHKDEEKLINTIHKNSHNLLDLVNQILDLDKLESGTLSVNPVQFYLEDFLQPIIANFEILANIKKIDFRIPHFLEKKTIILTDAPKLKIILKNLLSNALKFTASEGQIALIYLEVQEQIHFAVQDNGVGIAEEDINHVFDRYFQVTPQFGEEEGRGGTGIGLSICNEYAKLLQGKIKVSSRLGKGTTFTVTIPKRMAGFDEANIQFQQYEAIPLEVSSIQNQETKITPTSVINEILIIEDNLELCQYFKMLLGSKYKLSFTHNGKEGLDYLEERKTDLIITDLMMPVMDGNTFLKKLKSTPSLQDIPVLMLTAKRDQLSRQTALKLGVDDYLLKPFDEEELGAHIRRLLEFSDKRKKDHKKNDIAISEIDEITQADRDYQKQMEWIRKFESIVFTHIGKYDLNMEFIANKMELSVTHLNRKIKFITGLTTKKYVQEMRYKEARRMLEEGEHKSVKAATYSVGFKSEKYFSRNFKKRFGKNPSNFLT